MEEIKYTININSDSPIMLINDCIGLDGIVGSQFQKELLWLDSLGKKSIEIWINSIGGSVMDGYSIASSILKSKTPVDTYNVGLAASIAGVIFMCGRNRVMMDYAQLMIHPVSGTEDKKSKKSFESSLQVLLAAKADISQEQVADLMKETSWLNAGECLEKGLATRIEDTSEVNKQRVSFTNTNVLEFLEITNKIIMDEIPSIIDAEPLKIKNNKIMLKVINKLGLTEDATEDIILNKIELIENTSKAEVEAIQEEMEALKAKHSEEMNTLNEKIKDAKVKDCVNMVNEFVEAGKISGDESIVNKWVELAENDFDGIKLLLESTPAQAVNKQAEIINTTVETPKESYMAEKLRNLKNKK